MGRKIKSAGIINGRWICEFEGIQRSHQKEISPDDLPFDRISELGEVYEAELKSPGVYYLALKKGESHLEVYVVTADAPAISKKARTYGQEFPGRPDLRVYELGEPGSGWHIIDFEVRRHQIKHHLHEIEIETEDSLCSAALYGAEEHPEYFGNYPVPLFTPRGCTVRHKVILNGVYWLETDRCEELLAVCYPLWHAEISIPEQKLGEQLEYDRIHGINNTLGYLFFSKQGSAIPLYELSFFHSETKENGVIDMAALLNAICEFYPEYAAAHNAKESEFGHEDFIKETPDAGTEFFTF